MQKITGFSLCCVGLFYEFSDRKLLTHSEMWILESIPGIFLTDFFFSLEEPLALIMSSDYVCE